MNRVIKNDTSMLKRAISLGIISNFAYLVSYYLRNLLSVAAPGMQDTGLYTAEFIGTLSSVYFLMYAFGQLVNGLIGDSVNPKFMVVIGLSVTAAAITVFPLVSYKWMQIVCFALMGASLSMLRGPITKMVSENLSKGSSRVVCTCLTTVTFLGPLVASMFAVIFKWNTMFIVAGLSTFVIAAVIFVFLSVYERKGLFVFHSNKSAGIKGYLQIFKLEHFVFYVFINAILEAGCSTIAFWIPTYLSSALNFDEITTNAIYSVTSVIICFTSFFTLIVFKLVKEKDIVLLRYCFSIAAISFVCSIFVPGAALKVILLTVGRFCIACGSSVLWNIYIPGKGKTGKVSSINGVINCTGYLSASVTSAVFASIIGIGWTGVFLVWGGMALTGLIASLIVKQKEA